MRDKALKVLFFFALGITIGIVGIHSYERIQYQKEQDEINQEMAKNLRESLEIQKRFLELFEDK